MTKLPRDLRGADLCKRLSRLGYRHDRTAGDHFIMVRGGAEKHTVSVPQHRPLKPGTLAGMLKSVAASLSMTVNELLAELGLR